MAAEMVPAETYFMQRLSGDPTMVGLAKAGFHSERIHSVPSGASAGDIYIIWSYVGGTDLMEVQGVRIYSNLSYLIRAIQATGDFSTLQPADDRMDFLLHRAPPSNVTVNNLTYNIASCIRERPFTMVEQLVDIERRQSGGYYRVLVQP